MSRALGAGWFAAAHAPVRARMLDHVLPNPTEIPEARQARTAFNEARAVRRPSISAFHEGHAGSAPSGSKDAGLVELPMPAGTLLINLSGDRAREHFWRTPAPCCAVLARGDKLQATSYTYQVSTLEPFPGWQDRARRSRRRSLLEERPPCFER